MKDLHPFALIAALSATALVLVAASIGLSLAVLEALWPSDLWDVAGAFRAGFVATLAFGAIPAVLLGAPGYWLIWRSRRVTAPQACCIGAMLGASVGLIEPALAAWGIGCGAITAGLTHGAAVRWLGDDRRHNGRG
ncbi:hypothetical protein HKW98_01465 [Stutzerimonas urumqiensis]|uniref:hypothetical protein n=1 Tax=Stutzerimonas urumqiensis TaxID=638269 RepID=UPI003BAD435D